VPPIKCNNKLEIHISRGIFIGYTGTISQVYYFYLDTKRIKTTYTAKFDEAGGDIANEIPNNCQMRLFETSHGWLPLFSDYVSVLYGVRGLYEI
jgi:hypothetical protein